MQTHAHPSKENRFYVDSAVTSGQRYQVDLESNDWGYGNHQCSCPDALTHPGRYCKHIRAVTQRILAVLPTDIEISDNTYSLDADTFTYRPDPGCHESAIDASKLFYQVLRQEQPFYHIVHMPATAEEIITRSIKGHRSQALRLIADVETQEWYVKSKHETLVVIDLPRTAADLIIAIVESAGWYLTLDAARDMLRHRIGGRYQEFAITRTNETHQAPWYMSDEAQAVRDSHTLATA